MCAFKCLRRSVSGWGSDRRGPEDDRKKKNPGLKGDRDSFGAETLKATAKPIEPVYLVKAMSPKLTSLSVLIASKV